MKPIFLGLLGMYFDASVLFVSKFSLLFRLALAIHDFHLQMDLELKKCDQIFIQGIPLLRDFTI